MFQPKLFLFCSFNSFQLEFWSQPNAPEAERYTARRSGTCRTGRKEWESRWWAVGIGEASTTGLRAWLKCHFFGCLNLNFVFFLKLFFGGEEGGEVCAFFCCHFWDVNFCWMLILRVTRCRGANFGDAVVSCLCHSGGLGEYLWRGATQGNGTWKKWWKILTTGGEWKLNSDHRKFQFHFNNFSSQPGILVDMTLRGFSPSSPRFCSYKLTWKREKNYEYEFQPSMTPMTRCWRRGWLRTSDLAEKRDPSTSPECLYRWRTFQPVDGLTGWRCRVWIGVKRNGKLLESENSWSVSHVKLFLPIFLFLLTIERSWKTTKW